MKQKRKTFMVFVLALEIVWQMQVNANFATTISNKSVTLTVGKKKTISVKNYKKLSSKKIKKVKWTSSNQKVVTVKARGKYKQKCTLTAKKAGKATASTSTSTEESATGTDSTTCYEVVDSTLSDLCKSDKFINATDDEKAKLALSTMEELEAKGLIMQDSITYNAPNNSSINFKYTNGASGVFVLKEFDERLN